MLKCFSNFFQYLPNLQNIEIRGPFILSSQFVNRLTQYCPLIQKLNINLNECQLSPLFARQIYAAYADTLVDLTVNFYPNGGTHETDLMNTSLSIIGEHLLKLRRLEICLPYYSDPIPFPVKGFVDVINKCHLLESIVIYSYAFDFF